jgi:hypothetical protein
MRKLHRFKNRNDMDDNLDFLYDEDDAVKFIKNFLPEDIRKKFNDDDILYILDLVDDFYASKGYLDENGDDDEDVEIVEDELIAYVVKNALSDGVGNFEADDVSLIVQGELEYCVSNGFFEE